MVIGIERLGILRRRVRSCRPRRRCPGDIYLIGHVLAVCIILFVLLCLLIVSMQSALVPSDQVSVRGSKVSDEL